MKHILTIQGSLSPESRTAKVLELAHARLREKGAPFEHLDLRTLDLMQCDGRPLAGYNEDMQGAHRALEAAGGYIFGMPVYCWSISGPLKNLIDITASAMENKVAGIICNAGSPRAFLASSDLAKILFYESNVMTVHPIVHTSCDDFDDRGVNNPKVEEKVSALVDQLVKQLSG